MAEMELQTPHQRGGMSITEAETIDSEENDERAYRFMKQMHERLGKRHDKAILEDVYGLLNCAGCNPCHGWLNKNETLRNATTAWAQSLNAQYEVILKTAATDFPNLKLHYVDPQWGVMINKYVESGGKASDLIEPSDGFHPSQLGNELLAGLLWDHLEQHFPDAIGRVNPFNAEIVQKFGDQGGF